ncbi:hypothetical protein ACHAP8_010344 [Fusarium lateritium]
MRKWEDVAIEGLHAALNETLVDEAPSLDTTPYELFRNWNKADPAAFYVVTPSGLNLQAENTIKCQLYNSSYSVNFTFDNGLQDIKYEIKILNGISVQDGSECRFGKQWQECNPVTAYLSLMNAIGGLLLGAKWHVGDNVYGAMRTRIGSTTLVDSPDMHTFYREKPRSPIKEMPMGDTLEELFTNVTISIFSESQFLSLQTK